MLSLPKLIGCKLQAEDGVVSAAHPPVMHVTKGSMQL
jgi:hypothetical protein